MERDQILERLRRIARDASVEDIDWQGITSDTTIESLGFDSLSILDLLYDVEQEFGVAPKPEEVMKIRTVGGLTDLLASRLEAK